MSLLQKIPRSLSSNSGTAEPRRTWANAQCSWGETPISSSGFWIRPCVHWFLAIQRLNISLSCWEEQNCPGTFCSYFSYKKNKITITTMTKKRKKKAKWKHFPSYPVIVFFRPLPSSNLIRTKKKMRSVLNKRKPASDYNAWIVETNTVHNGRKSG